MLTANHLPAFADSALTNVEFLALIHGAAIGDTVQVVWRNTTCSTLSVPDVEWEVWNGKVVAAPHATTGLLEASFTKGRDVKKGFVYTVPNPAPFEYGKLSCVAKPVPPATTTTGMVLRGPVVVVGNAEELHIHSHSNIN